MTAEAFVYDPSLDGDADPGEIVWTWIPYEEDASHGKDRPAVVVSRVDADVVLCPLSSKSHEDRPDGDEWIELGAGGWDESGRVSYVDCSRLVRAAPDSIRREGAILERDRFDAVVAEVKRLH